MGAVAAPAAAAPGGWGGFRLVPTLLAGRVRMVVNAALRGGRERRGWTVLLGLGVLTAMVVGYRVAAAAFALSDPDPATIDPILAGLCTMVAAFTAVTAVTFALSAFYFARDLETLLVTPLPPRSVLLTKLLVQLGTGLAVGAVLVSPPLVAYLGRHGAVAALPWLGLCVVAMATFPLVGGAAVTVLAVRLLPARRVREAGGLLVTATVFGITAFNLVVRGPDSFTHTPGFLDPSRQSGVAGAAWLPTGWAARAGAAGIRGDLATAALWGLPMIAGAALLLLAAARLLEAPFLVGFQRSLEAGSGRRRRRVPGRPSVRGRGTRPAWLVIAHKDLRETVRDPSQLGQLILPLALFALYIASPSSVGVTRTADLPAWFGTFLTAGFASLFAASGIGLRGIGLEGARLGILRAAPVRVRDILLAKFLSGAAVAVALGLLLLGVGVARLHLGILEAIGVSLRLAVVVGGLVGLAVGIGAVRPRLDWTDPRRSIGLGTSLAFMATGAAYLGIAFVVEALPYGSGAHPSTLALAAADSATALLAMIAVAVPLAAGAARLRALEL